MGPWKLQQAKDRWTWVLPCSLPGRLSIRWSGLCHGYDWKEQARHLPSTRALPVPSSDGTTSSETPSLCSLMEYKDIVELPTSFMFLKLLMMQILEENTNGMSLNPGAVRAVSYVKLQCPAARCTPARHARYGWSSGVPSRCVSSK